MRVVLSSYYSTEPLDNKYLFPLLPQYRIYVPKSVVFIYISLKIDSKNQKKVSCFQHSGIFMSQDWFCGDRGGDIFGAILLWF